MINNPALPRIQDEGIDRGIAHTLNFIGAGVTATVSGGTATINVPGGGGGGGTSVSMIEYNLGSIPVFRGRFTLLDARIDLNSRILIWQAPGPYFGKGSRADEDEMDRLLVTASPTGLSTAEVRWQTSPAYISAKKIKLGSPLRSNSSTIISPQEDPQARNLLYRIHRVKGYFKFFYIVGTP